MAFTQPAGQLWKHCAQSAAQAELCGNLRSAEDHYRLALMLAANSPDCAPEDVGEALISYADFLTAHKRWHDAERYFRRAIDVYNAAFGEDNLITGMIYRILGEIYTDQQEISHARIVETRVHEIIRKRAS